MAETKTKAPVYRYFTADLLTNEILAEVPFRGVSYERAIKGAGRFGGSIAVNPQTEPLNLYESTMPGNTALFVVRDGVCVWGGIIWQRDYDIVSRSLQVSASEFTSYFYHRRIWKTWNHEYGGILTVDADGLGKITLDYGMTESLRIGSSFYLSFQSADDIKYNNYYKVGSDEKPTTETFTMENVDTVTDIVAITRSSNTVTFETDGFHHLKKGDVVDTVVELYPEFTGRFTVASVIDSANNLFTVQIIGSNIDKTVVTGSVTRSISEGTYYGLTITINTDTYDYIRKLIDAVMNDFSGIEFPNNYIEPGVTYYSDITLKQIGGGIASITTSVDHNLAEGQDVRIENLDSVLDGEHAVRRVVAPNKFTFLQSGTLSETIVGVKDEDVIEVSATASVVDEDGKVVLGKITMTTATTHEFSVGDYVEVTTPIGYQYGSRVPNGVYKITDITANTFSYVNGSGQAIPSTTFGDALATVSATSFDVAQAYVAGNKVTVVTAEPHSYSVGNSVTVTGASPYHEIKTRSIDYFPQTENVAISSLSRVGNVVTVNTTIPHNLSQYELVNITGVTTATALNLTGAIVASVVDSDTFTYVTVASGSLSASVGSVERYPLATLTASADHHLQAGDVITVSGLTESVPVQAVEYVVNGNQTGVTVNNSAQTKNTVTLTTTAAHGFSVGNRVTISGTTRGSGKFNGTFEILTIPTTSSLTYKINEKQTIASGVETGTILGFAYATITTSAPHNFKRNSAVTLSNVLENYRISSRKRTAGVVELTTTTNHNIQAGDEVTVSDLYETISSTQCRLIEGTATLTVPNTLGLAVNDKITVKDVAESYSVISASRKNNIVKLTLGEAHNIKVGDDITLDSIKDKFYGPKPGQRKEKNVTEVNGQNIKFEFASNPTEEEKDVKYAETRESGTVSRSKSIFDGDHTISSITSTSISYSVGDPDVSYNLPLKAEVGTIEYLSPMNGKHTVASAPTATTFTYSQGDVGGSDNLVSGSAPRKNDNSPYPTVIAPTHIPSSITVYDVVDNVKFKVNIYGLGLRTVPDNPVTAGVAETAMSVFNGTKQVVSVPTDNPLALSYSADRNLNGVSVSKQSVNNYAYFRPIDLFNGATKTITDVVDADNSFSFVKSHSDVPVYSIAGKGSAVVRPVAISRTYGGFPGNADIGLNFSTRGYSGVDVKPTLYRGFELVSVGEALDKYSDNIDGFEYRIDCTFDETTQSFTKTFVLIPINYPNPPAAGELSPLSRFGADKYVFEYPGNISNVSINESAENSSTRFFALGSNDAGSDVGANYSAASDTDLLGYDSFGRKWPLLDDDEKIDNTDDKNVLYAYADKYMKEARPPDAEITIAVNGALEPAVGSYAPGDWCAIVIDDSFVRARLATDLEPRDNVLVRKIEAYSVSVPDGVTFPEKVTLKVVPEWEVDKRG
jgi:hypothetical protein